MAATVSIAHRDKTGGGLRLNLVDVTMDSSYPTGGESVTPNQLGLSTVVKVFADISANGRFPLYDAANEKLKVFIPDPASSSLTVSTSSGAVIDDDSAASNGTALNVVPYANGAIFGYLESNQAGTADTTFSVGGTPDVYSVQHNATPDGVQLYFDEDAATADSRFLCVSPTGRDLIVLSNNGKGIRVKHDASAASNGVAVYYDDDNASAFNKLLFVSPTNANGTYTTDDTIAVGPGLLTADAAAGALAEIANGTNLSSETFSLMALGY